jgi:hypothetical protein
MIKKPLVIDLIESDFSRAANRQLVDAALEQKAAFRCYFAGSVIDNSVLCRYPESGRAPAYFPVIDFRNPRFIRAIEDYVIGNSRAIVAQAALGGATTAIRQIFGKSAMELIETGHLPMAENCSTARSSGKSRDVSPWAAGPATAPSALFRGLRLVKG